MWQKVSSYYIALRAIRADPFLFSNVEEQNEDYFFLKWDFFGGFLPLCEYYPLV